MATPYRRFAAETRPLRGFGTLFFDMSNNQPSGARTLSFQLATGEIASDAFDDGATDFERGGGGGTGGVAYVQYAISRDP